MLIAPALVLFSLAAGCVRGVPSDKPPIHIVSNMDSQPKYKPRSLSPFFADSSAMRTPAAGTIARGSLRHDSVFYWGKDGDGNFVKNNPLLLTMELLTRGQERYGIYCTPCHDAAGNGKGAVFKRNAGLLPPTSYHDDRLRNIEDGHIYDVITHGIRTMQGYAAQIPVEDRWAIVAYFRALQRSQNAKLSDVPSDQRDKVK
ncbi:MAG: cytochrome c [candidate division Zixibacteria bacterium]|nr:cytochrome c [candidate division Zixibacteria bacterium]